MVWNGKKLSNPSLQRVNDAGVPHPDPRYQGWYYRPYSSPNPWETDQNTWQYFRFTFHGDLEVHHFCSDVNCARQISPLGSPNFSFSSRSEGGHRCNNRK